MRLGWGRNEFNTMHPIHATFTDGPRDKPNRIIEVEILRPADMRNCWVCRTPDGETVHPHFNDLQLKWTTPKNDSREGNPS